MLNISTLRLFMHLSLKILRVFQSPDSFAVLNVAVTSAVLSYSIIRETVEASFDGEFLNPRYYR